MLPFSGDPYFGRVEIETCLKFKAVGNCFVIEFRVGCEKKYIVKDVLAFVWNVKHNEKFSYGKILNLFILWKLLPKNPEMCFRLSWNGWRTIMVHIWNVMNSCSI